MGLVVTDHVSAMLAYWDKNLVCQFANAAYRDYFGITAEEILDKITMQELLGPLYEKNLPYIIRVLQGESKTFECDMPLPSGAVRNSLANYYPHIVDGTVIGFFVHVADITLIKSLQEDLRKSYLVIAEQNKELQNFANIASHNLGNYAYGFRRLIHLLTEMEDAETKNTILDRLTTNAVNFSETVKNLRDIANVQNLKNIELEEIDLYEYVVKVISTLQVEISESNATVKNKVQRGLIIRANSAYVESILNNLLTNSIKYKQVNTALIIVLETNVVDEEVALAVVDNARGIDMEKIGNSLFEMNRIFHGNCNSSGLGLFMTKYQIEKMGGRIQVESKENVGSKFTVYFKMK